MGWSGSGSETPQAYKSSYQTAWQGEPTRESDNSQPVAKVTEAREQAHGPP